MIFSSSQPPFSRRRDEESLVTSSLLLPPLLSCTAQERIRLRGTQLPLRIKLRLRSFSSTSVSEKLSGSTYVFGVRSRSSVSLAVVSATTTKLTRPRVSSSRLANQHYLSACFLGRCCIGHVSQSPMALGRDRKTRFSSFAQTIDTMHSLRRIAYFASDFLVVRD